MTRAPEGRPRTIMQIFLFPSLPLVLALALLWILRSAALASFRRIEHSAAELVEDVRALGSRNALDRLQTVLRGQDTPFARALAAVVADRGNAGRPIDEEAGTRMWEEGAYRRSAGERLFEVIALLVVLFGGLMLVLGLAALFMGVWWGAVDILGLVVYSGIPAIAAVVAFRMNLTLGRARFELMKRQRELILEAVLAQRGERPAQESAH